MAYLFFQTLTWIVLAFLLGIALGWLLRGAVCGTGEDEAASTPPLAQDEIVPAAADARKVRQVAKPNEVSARPTRAKKALEATKEAQITASMRPKGLRSAQGTADDLKRIKGIGPAIEKKLNSLGLFHFTQIADLSADNINWVDNEFSFRGRVKRERWLSQAAKLARGQSTEFAKRYDKRKPA